MKRELRIPFLIFVLCLVAAMPSAWGEGGVGDLNLEASASLSEEVTLCHVPPGDSASARTIVVRESWGAFSVRAHLAHGDYLGECQPVCQVSFPSPVPKTGQTVCWDMYFGVIGCVGTGQDGEYQKGVAVDPRFTDNGDGTVTDNLTGLIWLKNANCFGQQDRDTALSYCNSLASGTCGLTDGSVAGDWRLPNVKELQSLIDFGHYDPPLPAGHPFYPGAYNNFYWSSNTYVRYPSFGWGVSFSDGTTFSAAKTTWLSVWPVRGGQ